MREDEIRRLVRIVEESNVAELEIKRWGQTIKISKYPKYPQNSNFPEAASFAAPPLPPANQSPPAVEQNLQTPPEEVPTAASTSTTEIKSPMVGTFYRAPAPDAEPYTGVGQTVKKGQVLCIIEAMKLMNEIESELEGKIVKVLVESGQPVEYNQPLFRVELH